MAIPSPLIKALLKLTRNEDANVTDLQSGIVHDRKEIEQKENALHIKPISLSDFHHRANYSIDGDNRIVGTLLGRGAPNELDEMQYLSFRKDVIAESEKRGHALTQDEQLRFLVEWHKESVTAKEPPATVITQGALKKTISIKEETSTDIEYEKAVGTLERFMKDGKLTGDEMKDLKQVTADEKTSEYAKIAAHHNKLAQEALEKGDSTSADKHFAIAGRAQIIDKKITGNSLADGELTTLTKDLLDKIENKDTAQYRKQEIDDILKQFGIDKQGEKGREGWKNGMPPGTSMVLLREPPIFVLEDGTKIQGQTRQEQALQDMLDRHPNDRANPAMLLGTGFDPAKGLKLTVKDLGDTFSHENDAAKTGGTVKLPQNVIKAVEEALNRR